MADLKTLRNKVSLYRFEVTKIDGEYGRHLTRIETIYKEGNESCLIRQSLQKDVEASRVPDVLCML